MKFLALELGLKIYLHIFFYITRINAPGFIKGIVRYKGEPKRGWDKGQGEETGRKVFMCTLYLLLDDVMPRNKTNFGGRSGSSWITPSST